MVGSNIKYFRKEKRLTQDYLAKRLGVSRQAICMWESEKRELRATVLKQIALILKVPVGHIVHPERIKLRKERMMRLKKGFKSAGFKIKAPKAKKVAVSGDFNSWDTKGIPLKKSKTGIWSTSVPVKSGRYEYKFIVDNDWQLDPKNKSVSNNSFGKILLLPFLSQRHLHE